jgi:lambda repressor-like predicted transcriptional regulator
MPKARAPLDVDRYQELHRQGLSLRQIAKELGIPESTLRDNLKVRDKARAAQGLPQSDQGPPQEDQGLPMGPPYVDQGIRSPDVSLGPPQPDQAETAALSSRAGPPSPMGGPEDTSGGPQGTPDVSLGGPPLYVHPGIPDDSEESVVGAEHVEEGHQAVPSLPLTGLPEGDQGPPLAQLSPALAEALTTAWPEIQQMLAWWRDRQHLVQDAAAPERQLERQTYHIEKRFIEAVRREADLTGESYAAIVNRAFAQYFAGKST